jgi:exonuclease VII small subunit
VLGIDDGPVQRRTRQAGASEEGRRRLEAWLDSWERGRQLRLIRSLDPAQARSWCRKGFRREEYESWVLWQGRARGQSSKTRSFLRGTLQELVAAELHAEGWDLHAGIRRGAGALNLVKDLATALHPDVDRVWILLPQAKPEEPPGQAMREVAAQFESQRRRLEALVRLMLEQYSRLLLET